MATDDHASSRDLHLNSAIAGIVFALIAAGLLIVLEWRDIPYATQIWAGITLLGIGGYVLYLKQQHQE